MLEDNNKLQQNVIDLQTEKLKETKTNKKSFSQVLSEPKPKPTRIPLLTIKNKDPNQKNTNQLLTQCLVTEKNIQTKFIRKKNDSEFEISCTNAESLEKIQQVLSAELENCDVEIEKQKNPIIKIVGIENSTNMDIPTMENDINTRNFNQFQDKSKILHTYVNTNNKTTTALLEVPADLYKCIRENKNKIFIGHQCCRSYDLININPCFPKL